MAQTDANQHTDILMLGQKHDSKSKMDRVEKGLGDNCKYQQCSQSKLLWTAMNCFMIFPCLFYHHVTAKTAHELQEYEDIY